MTRFRLPPRARNVGMDDGTTYRGHGNYRDGKIVDVDSGDHARQIVRRDFGGFLSTNALGVPQAGGRECETCGFSAWKYQQTCPRCGGPTREVTL